MSYRLQYVTRFPRVLLRDGRQTEVSRTWRMLIAITLCACCSGIAMQKNQRPRAREIGLKIGVLPTGALNSITDVAGVQVGHTTIVRGENIRTGVTAILPHNGNLFRERVPGAVRSEERRVGKECSCWRAR